MIRTIGLILMVVAAFGLVAGIALQAGNIQSLLDNLNDLNLDNVDATVTGLDDINLSKLLPLLQVFMGRAVSLDKITLPKSTQVTIADVTLDLPPGWQVAGDGAGGHKVYQTSQSTVIMVEDQKGNFAIITRNEASDPQAFVMQTLNQQAYLYETSGFVVDAYTLTTPGGHEAMVIDVDREDLAIQARGWVDGGVAHIITLTANPADMPVAEQVFWSLSS